MMRSTIAILLGFLIIIWGSVYISGKIDETSSIILDRLSQAEIKIHADNWEEALSDINQAYTHWSQVKDWWAIVLNHSTLNNIEISYLRLQQYAGQQEIALTLAELKTLLLLLKDVPESETLRFNNIF